MAVDIKYPHVEKLEEQPARLERVPRVQIAQIAMDYLEHGWSVDEMCRQHPDLSLSEAHSAMAYYFDHQEEIDREIAEEIEQVQSERARARAISWPRRPTRAIRWESSSTSHSDETVPRLHAAARADDQVGTSFARG